MVLILLAMLLRNPAPSFMHVQHVCHELRITRAPYQCSPVSARELRSLGYDPARDQAIAFKDILFVSVFNGDRTEVVRLPS